MKRLKNFGKAGWLFFSKAKEKQRPARGNPQLLHICFCLPGNPQMKDLLNTFLELSYNQISNHNKNV
ncbi:MAG: hypothetical protein K1X82_07115 [Bacteroidia bacterium]|nr:hypothetical protein [Bacteroidia bacterium]